MHISFIDILNYRRLKEVRIDFSETQTLLVGANNSGKTSAMNALMTFLKKSPRNDLSTTDFTLSNWKEINLIATSWVEKQNTDDLNLSAEIWHPQVPSIDVWLQVEDREIHYVSHLIPNLNWTGGTLGVRLIFEPKKLEELYKAYKLAYETAHKISKSRNTGNFPKRQPGVS